MNDQRAGALGLRVRSKETVADGVVAVTLEHPTGARLPDWTPGSHLDLVLPDGRTRQFSLCGDRWDPHTYRIGVLREPHGRGGSTYVHDELEVGATVGVGGPRNHFALAPSERYLFVAGGIGITPILPMLAQAELLGADWTLVYGGRTRASMAFLDELAAYGDRVVVLPEDEHGRLPLADRLPAYADSGVVYCCGPAPLLAATEELCADWTAGRLRTERFVAAELERPGREAPFEVELRRSGHRLRVTPDTTVLAEVRRAGIGIVSSCEQGICGTCEVPVLAGIPDHRDSLLDDDERAAGTAMFICVSRSLSDRLVLDL